MLTDREDRHEYTSRNRQSCGKGRHPELSKSAKILKCNISISYLFIKLRFTHWTIVPIPRKAKNDQYKFPFVPQYSLYFFCMYLFFISVRKWSNQGFLYDRKLHFGDRWATFNPHGAQERTWRQVAKANNLFPIPSANAILHIMTT